MTWIETTPEVHHAIRRAHKDKMKPFSSSTDMDGTMFGKPWMETEWAFIGANIPLLRIELSKEDDFDKEWTRKYYIHATCIPDS